MVWIIIFIILEQLRIEPSGGRLYIITGPFRHGVVFSVFGCHSFRPVWLVEIIHELHIYAIRLMVWLWLVSIRPV